MAIDPSARKIGRGSDLARMGRWLRSAVVAALTGLSAPAVHASDPVPLWPGLEVVVLPGPTPATPKPLGGHAMAEDGPAVLATAFDAPVYAAPDREGWVVGYVRAGTWLRASPRRAAGCRAGRWAKLSSGGYVCTSDGFRLRHRPVQSNGAPVPANLDRVMPYRYGKVIDRSAHKLDRLPTRREQRRLEAQGWVTGLQADRLDGAYFFALDRPVDADGRRFWRTVRGDYVPAAALARLEPPRMRGQRLRGTEPRPVAFVYGEARPLHVQRDGTLLRLGMAQKHARFAVVDTPTHGGRRYVQNADGLLVAREAVRLARYRDRPARVHANDKWVHIDLSQQTLVAYEGDRPVFATLVSSGREGYATPTGLFRVRHKYVSTRMRGDDPADGIYDISEVPWTMFYYRGYAVHGAYWHDDFGRTKSHGCTNLAPADARWLYAWSTPEVPPGWHGVFGVGTWLYFTA